MKTKIDGKWKKRALRLVGLSKEREFVGVGTITRYGSQRAPYACTASHTTVVRA